MDGTRRVDQPILCRMKEHGAVIEPFSVVAPCIRVGVEVNQRQGAVGLHMGLE